MTRDTSGDPEGRSAIVCGTAEPHVGSYFVAAYPPFSAWRKEQVGDAVRVLSDPTAFSSGTPLGVYVHIPFCAKRCDFCYYLSSAGSSAAQIDEYVAALGAELAIHKEHEALKGRAPTFIYFGGGTPSLLSERALVRLFDSLAGLFSSNALEEVTFECAPNTVTAGKMRLLRERGVTRLSLGVQSMNDDTLRGNGRIHLSGDIERAYASVRSARFPIVNIDLIVGLIGETADSFFESLDRVIAMQPESVTIYQLEIPQNTPLFRAMVTETGGPVVASWETKRRRLGDAFDRLEAAGYGGRGAYTRVRDTARHPFVYQDAQYRGADLLGIGMSSFSYLGGVHYQNETADATYFAKVHAGELPIIRAYSLSDDERLIREFVLQLKLGGIDAGYFLDKFGVDVRERFKEPLGELERSDCVRAASTDDAKPGGIELTRKGLLQVDRLLPLFYDSPHRDIRCS